MYSLSALPSSNTTLKVDSINTFIIRITATFMPSETTILNLIRTDIDKYGLVETLNVNRGLFSKDYNIAFRIKKPIEFGRLVTIIKNSFKFELGYDIAVVDVKTEFYEKPSIISPLISASQAVPQALSSIKWIAIAGLGLYGLSIVGPILKKFTK